VLLIAALAVALSLQARAEQPSFGDLLARAQAQAAAGHRWLPAGDNMTETVAGMMDIIATATPQQLADLSDLLEKNASNAPEQTGPARAISAQAAQAATVPASPSVPLPQMAPVEVAPVQMTTSEIPSSRSVAAAQASLTADRPAADMTTRLLDPPVQTRARTAIRPTPRGLELYVRGQEAERQGNLSGARRFFASATEQGSSAAARSLGRLYDPAYLKQAALGGIDADPALARRWYERAVAMGDTEAGPLLDALAVR
jgi:TPR repeat protein